MGNKHVLIVDDAIDLGRLLQDALKTAHPGIPITVVPSAEEAILESTRFTIDLLISDIRLPGMTGFELVRKIRIRQPDVKVMLISGLSIDGRMKQQMDDIKPDAFMHKPMGMPEFMRLASDLLGLEGTPLGEDYMQASQNSAQLASTPGKRRGGDGFSNTPSQPVPQPSAWEQRKAAAQAAAIAEKAAAQAKAEPKEETGLTAQLIELRGSLGALAAILLDERAHLVAQAGTFPEFENLDTFLAEAVTALSAGAKLSYLLGATTTQSVQGFRGKDFDLVMVPVGQFSIMVVMKTSKSSVRMALAFEEALNAREHISGALAGMGLHIRSAYETGAHEEISKAGADQPEAAAAIPAAVPTPATLDLLADILTPGPAQPEPSFDKLEELLAGGPAIKEDADSFWDTASPAEGQELNTPGVLSYEQALKLGLVPKSAEGK